jgi:predicted MPP superfamily phosphohydrolase/predicted Zn-dependent protease
MFLVTLLYNLAMLMVDVLAVWLASRRKRPAVWCVAMGLAGIAAFMIGVVLGAIFQNGFWSMRFWAYGIFLHGTLLMAATAVLWRRTRPKMAVAALAAAVLIVLTAVDAFLIEPTWLDVSHRRIESPKIFSPVRIVVLADLQTDRFGEYERSVLRRIMDEKPDLILFAGDYLQAAGRQCEILQRQVREFLREIRLQAPLGIFAVRGNCDPGDWTSMFEGTGVRAVETRRSFNLGPLRLTCLGLWDSFDASLELPDPSPGQFHLILGHVPNFALGKIDADLLVAGHTHGGQVCLPGGRAILTVNCRVPLSWASGVTKLPGGGNLFVSRGIGMERGRAPLVRFCCRPELAVIDLVSDAAPDKSAPPPAPFDKLLPLHKKLGPPREGDWLSQHPEPGQTYRQYLAVRPVVADARRRTIYIQPLGEFTPAEQKILDRTAKYLGLDFQLPVKTLEAIATNVVPKAARRKPGRSQSEQLLTTYILNDLLKPRLPKDAVTLIAFTAVDLWPGEGWNYVFGMASYGDRVGVWSIHRFGDPDGGDDAFRLCLLRTLKVAAHETGHIFTIAHCTQYQCNMCGSNHLPEADRQPLEVCPHCLAKLCYATQSDPVRRFEQLIEFYKENGLKAEQAFCEKSLELLRKE